MNPSRILTERYILSDEKNRIKSAFAKAARELNKRGITRLKTNENFNDKLRRMKMANNQNQTDANQNTPRGDDQNEEFEVSDQAQKLGGGKGEGGGTEIGNFGDDDFMKTDQSIAQAAPGQTATFDNQGGSD